MRVIVCGGRDYNDGPVVHNTLWGWPLFPTTRFGGLRWDLRHLRIDNPGRIVIVHGAARGADTLADKVAKGLGYSVEPHPARWNICLCDVNHLARFNYCPRAGFERNEDMAVAGAKLCVAFPGGNGTADMVARARGLEIPVLEVDKDIKPPRRIRVRQTELMKRA